MSQELTDYKLDELSAGYDDHEERLSKIEQLLTRVCSVVKQEEL